MIFEGLQHKPIRLYGLAPPGQPGHCIQFRLRHLRHLNDMFRDIGVEDHRRFLYQVDHVSKNKHTELVDDAAAKLEEGLLTGEIHRSSAIRIAHRREADAAAKLEELEIEEELGTGEPHRLGFTRIVHQREYDKELLQLTTELQEAIREGNRYYYKIDNPGPASRFRHGSLRYAIRSNLTVQELLLHRSETLRAWEWLVFLQHCGGIPETQAAPFDKAPSSAKSCKRRGHSFIGWCADLKIDHLHEALEADLYDPVFGQVVDPKSWTEVRTFVGDDDDVAKDPPGPTRIPSR